MSTRQIIDTWVPIGSLIGSTLLGGAAWLTARTGRRLGVSGVAGEARRDTIADRDAMYASVVADRDNWRTRALAAEAEVLAWHEVTQEHVPWDWIARQTAHDAGRTLPDTPALRPSKDDKP